MRKVAMAALALLLVAGLVGIALVRRSVKRTIAEVGSDGRLDFTLATVTNSEHPGFEPLSAPANYSAGAVFQGKLYLAGAGGLAEFLAVDSRPRRFRPGLELPPAKIVGIATGAIRGDSRPSLILATAGEGVLFYDGNTVRQLLPRSLSARDVTAVLPLGSGDLLIGTRQAGLLVYNGKTLTLFQPNLADVSVTGLAGDVGDLWIGTRSQGIFHWHAGQLDAFDSSTGLPDQQVESIAIGLSNVYVGTPLGVAEFSGSRINRILARGFFAHALATDGVTLTIASIDQGVQEIALTGHLAAHSASEESLQADSFFSAGDKGGLLAVTRSGLVRREASGEWRVVVTAESSPLADSNIAALNFAPDGRLWVGYFDRGIDILNLSGASSEDSASPAEHVEDDHIFCINRIVTDPVRHTIDVATANGLVLFDASGHQRQVLLRRDGLMADQVTDIAFTRDSTVLATPAGLSFIEPSGMRSLYVFNGLVNNHVYALAANANRSALLAGTLGGISYVNDGAIRRNLTTANSGLKQNWITAIASVGGDGSGGDDSSQDRWFVGTYGAGVMALDSAGHIAAIDGATRPAVINPNAMMVTRQHVFAGSLSNGLFVYNRSANRWSILTAGLPSRNVTALAEHDGQVYVGTDNGIVRIDESRLAQ
jgi:ligand-binding sensor domain-containing protein